MPELVLSLRERELGRFPIAKVRTTIGRDPSADVVIDNAGISRLHAQIEAVGDSFVVRDCDSQNGITLNGESCREGRLVHGDVIGVNKFLLRFSNQTLEVPENLERVSDQPAEPKPKDVQRTVQIDPHSAQALAKAAKEQIARQRAEIAARGGDSIGPPAGSPLPPRSRASLSWEEPEGSNRALIVFLGGVLVGGAVIAGLISLVF